jgi:hypothetical protein
MWQRLHDRAFVEVHGHPDCRHRPAAVLHHVSQPLVPRRLFLPCFCFCYVRCFGELLITCLVAFDIVPPSPDVPANFADAVIMNFPLNHLNDNDALLSIKEVHCLPYMLQRLCVTQVRCGACSRAVASHSSACKTGDCAACALPSPCCAAALRVGLAHDKLCMFPKGWQFGREPKWWLEVLEHRAFRACALLVLAVHAPLLGCAASPAARRQVLAVW